MTCPECGKPWPSDTECVACFLKRTRRDDHPTEWCAEPAQPDHVATLARNLGKQ
jgi:hypothetical protein